MIWAMRASTPVSWMMRSSCSAMSACLVLFRQRPTASFGVTKKSGTRWDPLFAVSTKNLNPI